MCAGDRPFHARPARGGLDACDIQLGGQRYRYLAVCKREPGRPAELTNAEREVCHRAALGETTRAIARSRGTSVRTVEHQLAGAFRKLGVASRSELCERLFDDSEPV